ncbi:MAG: NAD(P)/FAD-dependent oxidoreductase [Thermoplasmatales archaeon]|nr:NAD(P)/FAD-dependent oxidoreductase [Thermoplasmatales archaeon]
MGENGNSRYDVAIIGGGPSGTLAARKLSENGLKVIVLDKRIEIGAPDMCSDLINSRLLTETGVNADNILLDHINEITFASDKSGASFYMHSTPEKDVFNAVIAGDRFQKELASLAVEEGAAIEIRSEVKDILKEKDGYGLHVLKMGKYRNIQADYVINATGGIKPLLLNSGYHNAAEFDNFYFMYKREAYSTENQKPTIHVGTGDPRIIEYQMPVAKKWINYVSVDSVDMVKERSELYENSVTSGSEKIMALQNIDYGNGRFLNIGLASGLFNHFFFTSYNEAFSTAMAAADFIVESQGTENNSKIRKYEGRIEKRLTEEDRLSHLLTKTIMESRETAFESFMECLSGIELSEISVSEIFRKTAAKNIDVLALLMDAGGP